MFVMPAAPDSGCICILDDDEGMLGLLVLNAQALHLPVRGFQSPQRLFHEQTEAPLCLIVDWLLNGIDGLDVVSECRQRWPTTPILLISGKATVSVAVSAMRRGVSGVLEKPIERDDLCREIRLAIEGGLCVTEGRVREQEARVLIAKLKDHERLVLQLLVEGLPNKTIASRIQRGVRTVENYRHSLFAKLKVASAAQATRIWVLAKQSPSSAPTS